MKTPSLHLAALLTFLGTQSQALTPPPAQRLVVSPSAGESANAAYAVALGERYALLGSPESSHKGNPGNSLGEVFVFDATSGAYLKRLIAPSPKDGDNFGYAVAVSGSTAFVSAPRNDDGGPDTGLVYALDIPSGKLLWKYSGLVGQEIGESIAVDADNVIVGGYGQINGLPDRSGSVAHLNRLTGTLIANYSSPLPQEFGSFGKSVAVSGQVAICGAPDTTINGKNGQGLVAIIDLSVGQVQWLTPADGQAQDLFGHSVAVAGNRFIVGASQAATAGKPDGGAAYLYDLASLSLITKVLPPAAASSKAEFGNAVGLSGNLAAIGAWGDSATAGSVWLLDLSSLQLFECANRPMDESKAFGSCLAFSQNGLLIGDPTFYIADSLPDGAAWLIRPLRQNFSSSLQTIARTDHHAPGTEGASFQSFGEAAVSLTDKVIHSATLKGQGVTRTNNRGVWDNLSNTLDLVLRSGTATSTGVTGTTERLIFDQNNQGLFLNRQTNGKRAVFSDSGASAFHLFGEGRQNYFSHPATGANLNYKLQRIQHLSGRPSSGGEILANLLVSSSKDKVTPDRDSLIAFKQPGFNIAIQEGDSSPIAGSPYGHFLSRLGVADNRFVYATALQNSPATTNQALFIKTHGMNDAALIARKGDTAPGTGGGTFTALLGEGIVGGKVVLRAAVRGGASGATEGIWSNRDGTLKAVALSSQQAPGLGLGVRFKRFQKYFLTASQDSIVFQAQVAGPGITAVNDTGIWFSSNTGNLFLLLVEGQGAPDATGSTIAVLHRLDVDTTGNYLILASLKGAPASNQALYLGSIASGSFARRLPILALRKGSYFDRPGAEQLKSLNLGTNNLDPSGCGSTGLARLLNPTGPVFTAEFADRSQELLFGRP